MGRIDLAALEQSLWSTAAVVFYLPVANGSVLYLEMVYGEYTVRARTLGFEPWRDTLVGLLAGGLLAAALVAFSRAGAGRRMLRALRTHQSPTARGVALGVGAIGEELLFRGVLQPLVGPAPSLALFTLTHVPWKRDLWPWPLVALASGAVLSACFALTGAVLAGMVAQLVLGWTTFRLVDRAVREAR